MKYLFSFLALTFMLNCATNKTSLQYATVQYEAGPCFGFCPIYKMTIKSDRTAIFDAERFNFSRDTQSPEREGTFKGKINEEQYHQLISVLNSLQPKNLKDFYGNKYVSDLPTSYLTVNYKDGSAKKIQDHGKNGTAKLEKLYEFFENLKTNQLWTKIE